MGTEFETLVSQAVTHAESHEGWDFSYLDGRRHSDPVPWSYDDTVLHSLDSRDTVLDMDTGGGEKLLALHDRAPRWPQKVIALEAYKPNLPVARRNLQSIGVTVTEYASSKALPLEDSAFSIVVNRHGDFEAAEVARILRSGGKFITQQVGSDMCIGLNRVLKAGLPETPAWTLDRACRELEAAGLEPLSRQEFRGRDVFDDIGAIVWLLRVVPWQIPDFTVDGYRKRLLALHHSIRRDGPFDAGNHHFFVTARKPG